MTIEEVRKGAPKDATYSIVSAGHEWYLKKHWRKGWMIYHLHEWFLYKDTCFEFDLSKAKPLF